MCRARRALCRGYSSHDSADGHKHKETILLVEKEERVRKLSSYVLRQFGYHVLEADSGSRALGLWEKESTGIALMVTDATTPDGLSGWELVSKLKQRKPDLKVVYTSGYGLGQDQPAPRGIHFLAKPYSPDQLVQTIRSALNGGPGNTGPSLG